MRAALPLSFWLLLLLALAGCGGGSGDSDHDSAPPLTTATAIAPTATPTPTVVAGTLDPEFPGGGLKVVPRSAEVTVPRHGLVVLGNGSVIVTLLERTERGRVSVRQVQILSDGNVVDYGDTAPDLEAEAASYIAGGGVLMAAGRSGGATSLQAFHTKMGFSIGLDAQLTLSPIVELIPLADGDMLALGRTNGGLSGLQRIDVLGDLEPGFGDEDGVVLGPRRLRDTSTLLRTAAAGADGRILVAGTRTVATESSPIVLACDETGVPLRNFGSNGVVLLPSTGDALTLAATPDGGAIVALETGFVRLDGTGALDPDYTSPPSGIASALALAPDGSLTSVGATFLPDETLHPGCASASGDRCQRLAPAVTRLRPDGTPDARFGGTGTVATDTAASNGAEGTTYSTVALAPAGRITVAGTLCRAPSVCDVVVARYVDVAD